MCKAEKDQGRRGAGSPPVQAKKNSVAKKPKIYTLDGHGLQNEKPPRGPPSKPFVSGRASLGSLVSHRGSEQQAAEQKARKKRGRRGKKF